MSREIKFRAWDKTNNKMTRVKMLQFWSLDGGVNTDIIVDSDEEEWLYPPDFELMQYTGLKDKNGKEIYEGDIVKFIEYSHERVGSVVYSEHDGAWDVRFKFGKLDPMDILIRSQGLSDFEVIGNIYENPELLK